MILEREQIEKIMPHRGRALLLDMVEISDGRQSATGYLKLRVEHCLGHFPGNYIMRAVDRREMVAQTLGISQFENYPEGTLIYLASDGRGKFPTTATIGELVIAEVFLTHRRSKFIRGRGIVRVGERIIAEVEDITLAIIEPHPKTI